MTCPMCEKHMQGGRDGGYWRCTPCGLFLPVKLPETPKPPICHYPAGDRCEWCRAGIRHAHQFTNPYPTWYGPLPKDEQ